MDLNKIATIAKPRQRDECGNFAVGDAWLAGGTWLFSEAQDHLRRLVDLDGLKWPALVVSEAGLSIAATCKLAELEASDGFPEWVAWPLIRQCCRALYGSFKIWNMASVGGNVCLALPAGPMISLTAALDGKCLIWKADGSDTVIPVVDFILGPQKTVLQPGDLVRQIDIAADSLKRRTAFRRISLNALGRSAALLIGTRDRTSGAFALTVTAATRRPVQLAFEGVPEAEEVRSALDRTIPAADYYDDVHGAPDWRRHVTHHFAEEIRQELASGAGR